MTPNTTNQEDLTKLKGLLSLLTDYDRLYNEKQGYDSPTVELPTEPQKPDYEPLIEIPEKTPFKKSKKWTFLILLSLLFAIISEYDYYLSGEQQSLCGAVGFLVLSIILMFIAHACNKKANAKCEENYQKQIGVIEEENKQIQARNKEKEDSYKQAQAKFLEKSDEENAAQHLIDMRVSTIESTLAKLEEKFKKEYLGVVPPNLCTPEFITELIKIMESSPGTSKKEAITQLRNLTEQNKENGDARG